jgi:hypothetical protein
VSWLSEGLKKIGISKDVQRGVLSSVPVVGKFVNASPSAPPAAGPTNAAPGAPGSPVVVAGVPVPSVALWGGALLLVLVVVILLVRKR